MLDFGAAFRSLDKAYRLPLKWQTRLYERLARRDECGIPDVCHLPTGLGKTSVITIWLIALASGAPVPRRLVYTVNRRTVVDQATDDAMRLLARLYWSGQQDGLPWATKDAMAERGLLDQASVPEEHTNELALLRHELVRLSGDDAAPLSVSSLRGELADNGEWKRNPARPTIIIGTVDMIGSKLLFSGYGDGRYGRAHHAGLIGQDSLIVHDEAHLSPAFDELLGAVKREQDRTKEANPIKVMRLSATTRVAQIPATCSVATFGIEDEDHHDVIVNQRLTAVKRLRFAIAAKGKLIDHIADMAVTLGQQPIAHSRVLVYVRSPRTAANVAEAIKKALGKGQEARVGLLTGTLRGFERDALASSPLFTAFKSTPERMPLVESLFLVSTSAGEVGVDLDADHIVCDLSTLDSMAQRFGRVNRLGGAGRAAEIVVVTESRLPHREDVKEKAVSPFDAAVAKTGEILSGIESTGGNVSPAALGKAIAALSAEQKRAAFSPEPTILPATDILFDHWSLTSIAGRLPGRPEVGPYLHGKPEEWEPPETHVAWRADIAELAKAGGKDDAGNDRPCSPNDLQEVFDAFPLRSMEQLRDRTDRVLVELQTIAKRWPEQSVVLMKHGEVRWTTLAMLTPENTDKKRIASSPLAYATIVLPTSMGGLKDGTLSGGTLPPEDHSTLDVAEMPIGGRVDRQRVLVGGVDEHNDGKPLLGGESILATARHSVTLASNGDGEEGTSGDIEYRVAGGAEREPGVRVALSTHNAAVGAAAARIAASVGLANDIAAAVAIAGRLHDTGKDREIWQRYAKNLAHRSTPTSPGGPIAKSDKYGHWKDLKGYRHEFGSLLDAAIGPVGGQPPSEITGHPERDLILHLIAAHHGWSRPHFEPRHLDPGDTLGGARTRVTAQSERAAVEGMQRFARLQERFGRWGLAWLESLVRCADAEASDSGATSADAPLRGKP